MAATNPKVMAMIEAELAKDPSISNADLLEKAKKIDRSVGKLSPRQFNARYPLQVKRRQDGGSSRKSGAAQSRPKRKAKAQGKSAAKPRSKAKAKSKAGRAAKSKATPTPGRRRAAGSPAGDRAAVRRILLDYARKVAGADSMTDVMDLVMDVDRYVDRVMKAAS